MKRPFHISLKFLGWQYSFGPESRNPPYYLMPSRPLFRVRGYSLEVFPTTATMPRFQFRWLLPDFVA